MNHMESVTLNLFMNKVLIQCNRFHVGMKDHIGVQMSSTNIIITDHRYLWNTNTKFSKKWTYPTQFYKCTSNKKVFRFTRKICNDSLLLKALQNKVAANVDDISTCRSKVIFITSLISIKKSVKKERNCDKEPNHDQMCHKDIEKGA